METERVERLLGLIQTLQSGRAQTVDQLAESLSSSRRTLFRDLKLLAKAGLPFDYDRATKTYSTSRRALLPPVAFTHAEALALTMILRTAAEHPSVVSPEAAFSAVLKIEGVLPTNLQDHCRPLMERVSFQHAPASDTASLGSTLPLIQSAIANHWPLAVEYDSYYEGRLIDDVLEPYHLAFINRAWYIIARARSVGAMRTFKVERFARLRILQETFFVDKSFTLDDYFGNAWSMIRGDRRFHVRIRFLKKVAGNVDEVIWHKSQRTQRDADGSLIFEVDVDGIHEISWWVLGYGDQAQVLEPPELISLVAEHAARMKAYYEGSSIVEKSRPTREIGVQAVGRSAGQSNEHATRASQKLES